MSGGPGNRSDPSYYAEQLFLSGASREEARKLMKARFPDDVMKGPLRSQHLTKFYGPAWVQSLSKRQMLGKLVNISSAPDLLIDNTVPVQPRPKKSEKTRPSVMKVNTKPVIKSILLKGGKGPDRQSAKADWRVTIDGHAARKVPKPIGWATRLAVPIWHRHREAPKPTPAEAEAEGWVQGAAGGRLVYPL